MSRIIHQGDYGTVTTEAVPRIFNEGKVKIFIDDPVNFLDFRKRLTHFKKEDPNKSGREDWYIEVGFFLEMLYEGDIEAFEILNKRDIFTDYSMYEFLLIKGIADELISETLINNLVKTAKEKFILARSPYKNFYYSSVKDGKTSFERMDYDPVLAFESLRYLEIAKVCVKTGQYNLEKIENLSPVYDGYVSQEGVNKGFDSLLEEIREERENGARFKENPSVDQLSDILLKIRNVKFVEEVHEE